MITLMVLGYAASLCGVAFAQFECSFANSLHNGQYQARVLDEKKRQLIANGFLTTDTEPGGDLAISLVIEPHNVDMYQKALALLIAQQFYMNQEHNCLDNLTSVQRQTLLSDLSKTIPLSERCTPVPVCDAKYKYISYDGSCNNLENPKWGQSFTPYGRLVPAVYDDGIYTLRKSVSKSKLPLARLISDVLLNDTGHRNEPLFKQNVASVIMAQYINHDGSFRKAYQNDDGGPTLRCCSKDYKKFLPDPLSYYGCLPIEVPSNDPFLSEHEISCENFNRLQPAIPNNCMLGAAEHANGATHVLDNSNTYGFTRSGAMALRTMKSGKLLLDDEFQILAKRENCVGNFCYYTGDARATVFPNLALVHSIFTRFHNKIASKLAILNPYWEDETLYQESRRIASAVYQNIIFNEWLPLIIGYQNTFKNGLSCGAHSTYCGQYNSSVDSSTLAEFSSGAFRVFHANIPNTFNMYNDKYENIRTSFVSDTSNVPTWLETNYNDVLRGMLLDGANNGVFSYEMRYKTFKGNSTIGISISANDITRGRDAGLSPYHVYLNLAVPGGHTVSDWNDLSIVFNPRNIYKLKQVYESPFDIDLYVGMLLEERHFAYTGLVVTYIMVEQFKRYKFGNRFFYSLENGANPFTAEQIKEINKQTWASLLCKNTDIDEMLINAFQIKSQTNLFAKCSNFPSLNFNLWKAKDRKQH